MEDQTIEHLLEQMTLDEKISLCHANSKFTVSSIERLGISELVMSDGPHGVRCETMRDSWAPAPSNDDYVTYLPTGCALAATWSVELAHMFGTVLGNEARHRGKDIILGPGINIVRTPVCGRNFEYFSEDPYQAGAMGASVVKGIQEQDVACSVKHFALNNQEWNRHEVNVLLDERALREIYLPAFRAAVDAGAYTVMGAYNKVRGQWCCENEYLVNEILKEEWGFDGIYLSDWGGVHSTHDSVRNGLDIEMGTWVASTEDYYLARPFRVALERGELSESMLDDKVRRILRVMLRINKLTPEKRKKGIRNSTYHQKAARRIAGEAIVLLKNEGVLPLNFNKCFKLAVIGEQAAAQHAEGGGSSKVKALYEVTPLDALKRKAGRMMQVDYARGYRDEGKDGCLLLDITEDVVTSFDPESGIRSWKGEYYSNPAIQGEPVFVRYDKAVEFDWEKAAPVQDIPLDQFSVRWSATITPEVTGEYTFGVTSDGGSRVFIDGNKLVDEWGDHDAESKMGSVYLDAGKACSVVVEYYSVGDMPSIQLGWLPAGYVSDEPNELIAEAVQVARNADAVLLFVGQGHRYHVEGADRQDIKLHGHQNELIEAVVRSNPNTALLLVGGGAVEMPWISSTPCVVQVWFAGMEGGTAMADIIFGDENPSGKLPVTFPVNLEEVSAHAMGEYAPDDCCYRDGLLVGYRYNDARDIDPLFPFGHGLSYTTFGYGQIDVHFRDTGGFKVCIVIKNTGLRAGREVVQLYVSDVVSSVARPVKELKGFIKVALEPGEKTVVEFDLTPESFAFYSSEENRWVVEPGDFEILIGSSSRDIRSRTMLRLESAFA